MAQPSPEETREAIKVDVTGSNIPRSDAESALPVQVLTRGDILHSGATTTAELLSKVSANILGFNDQLALADFVHPGLASANLRGIGDGATLVLLNGRRVANYAFDGGTVDLNSIPLTAIDRIEILKDGASAIYGADAMAGVINFILRKDFSGLEATGYGAWTEHGGADAQQATITIGYGKLAEDRFNTFVTLSYQKEQALHAIDRPFSRTGFIPGEGVTNLSFSSFPASIQAGPHVLVNPAFATGCAPPALIPVNIPFLSLAPGCGYDYTSAIDVLPSSEHTYAIGRATFQTDPANQLFVEGNYAYNRFVFRNSPTAIFQGPLSSSQPVLYPVGGPYYPTEFAAENGLVGNLNLRYRTVQLGPQTNETDTKAWRVVAGAEGLVSGWSYGTAFTYSENRQTDSFVSGYISQQRFLPALYSGLINPFGASGSEGDALLEGTQIVGPSHYGKGTTFQVDAKASKDVYQLTGGPLAIALGVEARHERLDSIYEPVWTSGDVLGVGGNEQSAGGSRGAQAVFAEANLPLAKELEAQIAVRYDRYSDFGGTTNPKVALRWQPMNAFLLRGSWGTGFRAPTLYDLYTPLSYSGNSASFVDPIRCPVTGLPADCPGAYGRSFRFASGGNANLRPERSEQANAGVAWAPTSGVSLTVDYWNILERNVINALDPTVIFDNFTRYGPTNIIRGPIDPAFPNLPGPIETVLVNNQNLGKLHTSGIDVDFQWRGIKTPIGNVTIGLSGTYVLTWEEQLDSINYTSSLGRKGDSDTAGPVPRWKSYATVNWEFGAWGATIAQSYQSGYVDANIDRFGDPLTVPPRNVSSYEIWDLQGRYTGLRNTTIALGVKNLMDRAPPFSNQPFTRQVGYDPVYADPRGRTFYVSLTLAFK